MGKVQVDLGVRVNADDKIKDLARDLAALAKLPGVPAADAQRISEYANSVRRVRTEYDGASSSAFKLFDQTKNIAMSAVGGAGLGKYAMLLGAGGVGAAVAAAAAIASQLARMQYTFLETTTRSAASLSLGSGDFRRNLEAIQRGSLAGMAYGIAPNQMAGALATYGGASGYVPSASFAGALAQYTRGSGMDVGALAGGIGGIAQFGGDPTTIMRDAFDQAMTSGAFGRRMNDFIMAIAGMTQQLAIANPYLSGTQAASLATRAVGNLAGLGGAFATPAGNAAGLSALSGFGAQARGNQQVMSLALMAGVDPASAMLGTMKPEDEARMAQIAHGIYGKSPLLEAAFFGQFGNGADLLKIGRSGVDLNSPAGKKYAASLAAAQVGGTDYGQISGDIAKIVGALQQKIGGTVLHDLVVPALNSIDKFVTMFGGTGKDLEASMGVLTQATLALVAAQALGGGASLISKIGPMLLGGGLAAAGGAALAATIGFVAATTASGNNANEETDVANWQRFRKDGMKKPPSMSAGDWATVVRVGMATGVPPDLLASMDMQESTFGAGLTRQGTDASGHQYGRYQLTAANTYGSFDNRLRAAHDYEFATTLAAKSYLDFLKQEHGDVAAALNDYNGHQVKNYASEVLGRYEEWSGYTSVNGRKMKVTITDAGPNRAAARGAKKPVPRKR